MSNQKEWTTINRSGWPSGPWDGEPDKIQWLDDATGIPCLIVRNHSGYLCGYVGVPPGHALHGRAYQDVENVDVHGGLTYSDRCQAGETEAAGICHIPEPGQPADVWWLGFDCAHSGDKYPAANHALEMFGLLGALAGHDDHGAGDCGGYRNVSYVRDQCAQLAQQIGRGALVGA